LNHPPKGTSQASCMTCPLRSMVWVGWPFCRRW
jgi:hypothetical protein